MVLLQFWKNVLALWPKYNKNTDKYVFNSLRKHFSSNNILKYEVGHPSARTKEKKKLMSQIDGLRTSIELIKNQDKEARILLKA